MNKRNILEISIPLYDESYKTDQLYFFNKSKINYTVIGNIQPDIMNLVLEFIDTSDLEIISILDNL